MRVDNRQPFLSPVTNKKDDSAKALPTRPSGPVGTESGAAPLQPVLTSGACLADAQHQFVVRKEICKHIITIHFVNDFGDPVKS